jgi:hypothetical protein
MPACFSEQSEIKGMRQPCLSVATALDESVDAPIASPSIVGDATLDPIFEALETAITKKRASNERYAIVRYAYAEAKKRGLGDDSPLVDRNAFVEGVVGQDPDQFTDETADAYWEAVDDLFEVEPTTLLGVLA